MRIREFGVDLFTKSIGTDATGLLSGGSQSFQGRMVRMRQWTMVIASSLIVFCGCRGVKKPNEANLRNVIDQYLSTRTRTCIAVDGKFPLNVPDEDKTGEGAMLAALDHGSLVQSTETTAVVQSMANALSPGPHKPQPVKRYTVSSEGQRYFKRVQGMSGESDGFCYGHEKVDSIVNWTQPQTQGDYTETTVTYTYKVPDVAAWAKLPEVDQAFPSIDMTLDGEEKDQSISLRLSDEGWVVNGS